MPPRPDRSDGVRPGGVSRLRAIDPLVPAVAGVSLVVYVLHGFQGMLTRDLGIYSYAGQQVADGVPPYLGVLNRAGPLAHVLPGVGALVARLGGLDDVITMRVLFMLMATAAVCVSYLLGRDLFRSRGAGLVTASAMLAVHGFIQYASNGPREKTPMTLFVIGALWAVTHRRWFTAGVLTSLATLCLQTAFFSTFTAVAVGALLLATGGRIRALARIAVGGLVPVAVLGTWFALAGSLGAAWDGFYAINRRYTVPNPLDAERELVWDDLQVAYGVTVWLLLAGTVLLVAGLPGRRVPPGPGRRAGTGRAARHDGRSRGRSRLDPPGVRRVGRPVPGAAVRGGRAWGPASRSPPTASPAVAGTPWRGCSPSLPSSSR